MSVAAALIDPVVALRRRVRFLRWRLEARARLARHGISLEIVADGLPSFDDRPLVHVTRQELHEPSTGPGRVRIVIGPHVHLGRGLAIEVLPGAESELVLGEAVMVGSGVRIVLFGGSIELGARTRIRDWVMLKSSGRMVVGRQGILQNGSMVHCASDVAIGERVTFGERVTVLDSDHIADGSDTYTQEQPLAIDPVTLGSNTWIGANSVILRGVQLGRNAVVAAGSVVRGGEYPPGWLVAGAPAKALKRLPGAGSEQD